MRVPIRPRLFAAILPLAGAALLGSYPCSSAAAQAEKHSGGPAALSPELQRARAGLEKYQDPVAAVHDGYLSTLACVEYSKGGEGSMHYAPGGMGVHFLNLQFLGPTLDPAKPQVLIYEPVGQELRLAAAEWFVPTGMAAAGKPTIFGQELQGPMEGHEPLQPKGLHHYDLHVWLWKNNPAGVFSATNPSVKCPKGSYSFSEHPPRVVSEAGR
jgi:hypothetical protein